VTEAAPSPYRTYREPGTFWGLNALAVMLTATAVFTSDTGLRLLCAALVVMAVWGAWWIRLAVTPSGLTVAFIRSRHILWSDVRRLSLDPRRWRWAGSVLTVLTREGESIRVWAVSTGPGEALQSCRQTLSSLEAARRQHKS
jgi:hypothetical protein